MTLEKKQARLTGVLYLVIIICGIFSEGFVRGSLFVNEDPMMTFTNIMEGKSFYILGFISDLIMVVCDVAVAILFYLLLKSFNKNVAMAAAVFRLGQAAIMGMNLLNLFTPLLLLNEVFYLDYFSSEQMAGLVQLSLMKHKFGYLISQVFFAFNCAFMGYLLYRSKLFPKTLGVLISLSAISYLADSLINFTAPQIASVTVVILVIPLIGEFSLCLYLLFKGVREPA